MENSKNITILGAGTWGIALSLLLNDNGHNVLLYAHREETKNNVSNGINKLGVKLPSNISLTSNLAEALENSIIVIAIPSIHIKELLTKMKQHIKDNSIIINASKGIESESLNIFSEVIKEILPTCETAVLSGPVHAEELSRKLPAACVLACENENISKELQEVFMNDYFRIYTNDDILGVELAGATKNIIAIAAGMIEGLGDGDNAKAALITRGMNEIVALGMKMGGKLTTFYGLAGMGDMIVTCTSMHSRNCRAGILIGQGKNLEETLNKIGMVVEGIHQVQAISSLASKYGVEMPITKELKKILFEGKKPRESAIELMKRQKISEWTV
ncbi:MAG: NAD(P)-dependent glycerol-3-phosphate dehydrogenase [Defluviitaleaceae bacterium]|nr:NAD(P)-dependent glycerol-3-phosphate dehydrogenase [Defluviitaleaceae bacterium]